MINNRNLMLTMVAIVMIGIISSCSAGSKGNGGGGGNAEDVLDGEPTVKKNNAQKRSPEYQDPKISRVVRTGPQYIASVAKILGVNKSTAASLSSFEQKMSALPTSPEFSKSNIGDLQIINSVYVSSAVCGDKVQNEWSEKNLDEVIGELIKVAFPTAEAGKSVADHARELAAMVEDNTDEQKLVACSFIATAASMLL